eukprot:CAMPEP_0113384558 /NCGR_PEP_ID=MMETSP0013_2-20120614/6956_1 /TAXON_ID=2843 ORGANISM="Skeletonema costatum, Strain 1716" /NCGR_SAMPLE_ID=MMETSP0013_2 /ASSEMBLY_ACC=CAM_ASM_000158 /LENGTH=608 /DNA_ID=CAMNT_0000267173 /DNA_START=19 /DNA_END=1845 /DNA_ORIENTATION=- /assembly_acc=CAM_ASM_000158
MARTLTFAAARGLARSRLNCACSLTHIRSLTSATNENNINQHYDVIIAGGGAVGSVLARLLLNDNVDKSLLSHRRLRPLKIALLEQRSSPPSLENIANTSSKTKHTPNARAYALSPTSLSYLGSSVLQRLKQTNRLGIYDSMQIWEHDGPAQLHFAGEDLNEAVNSGRLVDLHGLIERNNDTEQHQKQQQQSNRRPWLGSVVEDAPLVSAVWDELRNDERIDLIDNVQITSISAPSQNTMGNVEPPPPVEISCTRSITNEGGSKHDEECTLSADLLVAADGANSFVRRTLGHSFPMITHSYDRKAVTCTVELDVRKGDMAKTAFQRFLPHGPIALLPVWNSLNNDDNDAPIYANVVWSTTPSEANHLLSLSGTEFITTLNHHLCQGPNVNPPLLSNNNNRGMPHIPIIGTIAKEMDSLLRTANTALTMGTWTESPSRNYFRMPPASARVVGPIMGFDLKLSHVQQGYTAPRVALVGDAAHTVHPMAGQGLNLGMGDVYSLSELIKEAVDSGMDVAGTGLFLDRYNQERMVKGLGTVGGVHGLHELFRCSGSNSSSGIMNANALNSGGNASGVESIVGLGRSLGMNVVNGLGPLRRAFAEAAAGAAFSR